MKIMLDEKYCNILQILENKIAKLFSAEWEIGDKISLIEMENYGYKWIPPSAIE